MFPNTDIEDITRVIITVGFLAVFAYLTITGREVSQSLIQILLIVVGFYFGINELGKVASKIYMSRKNGGSNDTTKHTNGIE